jgi:hypothetical protein
MFLALAPRMGCDPNHDYTSRKLHEAQKGCKGFFFSVMKGLLKMVFSHFKRVYSQSVVFAFFYANMQNSFSLFIQLKLMVFGLLFSFFF